MPSKPRKCSYLSGNRACGKPAYGNPPLCDVHAYDEEDDEDVFIEDDLVATAVDEVLSHKKVRNVLDKAANVFDRFAQIVDRAARPKPPGTPQPRRPQQEDPRVILGFSPGQTLTEELIKERRRELSKLFHPDKGGSIEAMQKVNVAADALLATLKK